ncbi:hypothetical protein ACOZ4I_06485 [Haloarcula salina]|uniref:hypothetical protein n=1 Tax=Haloarcula salina TaxID=1429914 RepID=UPI003C6ED761
MEFDENEPEPIVTPETPNSTKINFQEADNTYRMDGSERQKYHYKVLRNLNRGTHTRHGNYLYGMNTDREYLRFADNLAIYDSVAGQLDLSRAKKRYGKKLFKRVSYQDNGQKNFKEFSAPNDRGMGIALTAYCACSYVCWKSGWQTHPNQSDRYPQFIEVQERLGFSDKKLRKWYGRFEHKVQKPVVIR